jgi:hypothetical protein
LTYYFYKYTGIFKIYDIPFLKRRFKNKFGVDDPKKWLMDLNNNPDTGLSNIFAGALVGFLPFILLFGIHIFYFMIFWEKQIPNFEVLSFKITDFQVFIYPIFIYGVISYLISYIFLFRKDKYLKYFKKFNKKPHKWKVKWAWISFGVILFPLIVLISSFVAMSE